MSESQAILLLGPTASGKTALALRLAEEIPSEIISIDSALVYRHMDIGTQRFRIILSTSLNRRNVTPRQILLRTAYGLLRKYEIAERFP